MARHKDGVWTLAEKNLTWDQAQLAVLMDIRDELKRLANMSARTETRLRRISRNTFVAKNGREPRNDER